MAKTLSFLPHDDESNQIAEAIEKCSPGVPTVHWNHWIPQMCTSLLRKEGSHMINILLNVAKVYPQSVYFPIRTIYTYLKTRIQQEHSSHFEEVSSPVKEPMSNEPSSVKAVDSVENMDTNQQSIKTPQTPMDVQTASSSNTVNESSEIEMTSHNKTADSDQSEQPSVQTHAMSGVANSPSRPPSVSSNSSAVRNSALSASYSKYKVPLRFCTKVIFAQRDAHPTLLAALESIADQVN